MCLFKFMQTCSPYYLDDKGNFKNDERMEAAGNCTEMCIHYQACLIELNGGNKHIAPLMLKSDVDKLKK